tara:strand:- start:1846 stop:2490 length:645 start_codon:yes stop_codon:yes gene_type:complete
MSNNIEFEYRFYNINEIDIKKKIKDLGGFLVHDKMLMRVTVYYHPLNKLNYYIRIRNESSKNKNFYTLTVKKLKKPFPVEHEIIIDDPKEADKILKMLGCQEKYIIEKIRESWSLDGCKEIVFDSYLGLPTFIEIDCKTLDSLNQITKKLGFDKKKSEKTGIKNLYYKLYGIPKNSNWGDNVEFKKSYKTFDKLIVKNKDKFKNIYNQQLVYLK